METTRVLLWILVGIMTMGGFAGMYLGAGGNPAEMLMQKRLEEALLSAEMSIECGYADAGFAYFPPTLAIQNYLMLQKSLTAETNELYGHDQTAIIPSLPHLVYDPAQPWSIVFEPDDERRRIGIKGYGAETAFPLLQKELLCD